MKEKIILFAIGILVGAVFSTGIFCIYTATSNCNNQNIQMNRGRLLKMPNGQNGQRPEKSDGNSQPPEMPSNNNQTSN